MGDPDAYSNDRRYIGNLHNTPSVMDILQIYFASRDSKKLKCLGNK